MNTCNTTDLTALDYGCTNHTCIYLYKQKHYKGYSIASTPAVLTACFLASAP